MRKYELMFIVKPDLEESAIKGVFESMKKVLEDEKATILEEKEMVAVQCKYYAKTGYYFYFSIEAEGSHAVKEFDRVALINENIIRHLIVKVEE